MRWLVLTISAALAVPLAAEPASAHHLRNWICCGCPALHTPRHHHHTHAPAGSFGSSQTFNATGFGGVGFGSTGFGSTGFGSTGFGSTGFGWVPMTFPAQPGSNNSNNNTGFGAADDGFGFDPFTIAALTKMGIDIVGMIREKREARANKGGNPFPAPGTPPGTAAPGATLPTAELAKIHEKLDAIIVNQSVATSEILKTIKASDEKLDKALKQLDTIKAQTEKVK